MRLLSDILVGLSEEVLGLSGGDEPQNLVLRPQEYNYRIHLAWVLPSAYVEVNRSEEMSSVVSGKRVK